jgi:hypothetical protein
MTGRSQPLPWWLGGRRGKDDRKQNSLALGPVAQGYGRFGSMVKRKFSNDVVILHTKIKIIERK